MSSKELNLNSLISFSRLLGNSKKEEDINDIKEGVSESSTLSEDNKDKKQNFFSKLKKEKDFKNQNGNNSNYEIGNENQKESGGKKFSNGYDNLQNEEDIYQEYIELALISDIYEKNSIAPEDLNTIFMAETYLKTLPDYLPLEVKRKTVMEIINSSGLSADKLLEDGEERKKILSTYLQKFSQTTDKIVRDYQEEIQKLTERIQMNQEAIVGRKDLQEEQKAIINYEINRLQGIINFLKD